MIVPILPNSDERKSTAKNTNYMFEAVFILLVILPVDKKEQMFYYIYDNVKGDIDMYKKELVKIISSMLIAIDDEELMVIIYDMVKSEYNEKIKKEKGE